MAAGLANGPPWWLRTARRATLQPLRAFPDQPPRPLDVLALRRAVANRQPQREAAVQYRAGNEDLARSVHMILNAAVFVVRPFVAQADHRERRRRNPLEARVGVYFPRQVLRQPHVFAQHVRQALAAEVAHREP